MRYRSMVNLIHYSYNTSFQVLNAALGATLNPIRNKVRHDTSKLNSKLKDLLRIEQVKGSSKSNRIDKKESNQFADDIVNFSEISSILPEAGSESMDSTRIQRISKVVKSLDKGVKGLDQQGFLFVDEALQTNKKNDWNKTFDGLQVETYKKGEGCSALQSAFDKNISAWTDFLIAKRIGELELENKYQTDIHDEFFNHFNWESFSSEELNTCPHFVLLADDAQLFKSEFSALSTLLSNNIPIKVVAVKQDDSFHYKQNGSEGKIDHAQAGLGALMLSQKNIYVAQSTSMTPTYLFNAYKEGLSAFAPAFFSVLNIDEKFYKNPYVRTSAAIEGRDFPGFTYRGLLGTAWGSRFEVENNPQPKAKWPVHELTILDGDGNKTEMEFPFTFADQAVLNPTYHHYYYPVDSSFWSDNLIPLNEYMDSAIEENIGKVPFIWMTDSENQLKKVAVSWPIVLASQERLDFWRFLQENSGINNYHVTSAVENVRLEMALEHGRNIEYIKGEHEVEIQKIRDEEAGKTMENLTSVLLNLDTTNVVSTGISTTSPAPIAEPTAEPELESPEVVEEVAAEPESVFSNDPYIDTALCTSCNECTDMNDQMFKYDADKMAYIADPKAGTFKELVEAAEVCPVDIIHPGSPLNPDEPDLEDLIKRAEEFN